MCYPSPQPSHKLEKGAHKGASDAVDEAGVSSLVLENFNNSGTMRDHDDCISRCKIDPGRLKYTIE